MDRKLIDYLPPVIKEVREIKAIMDTEQPEISDIWDAINNILNDQFVIDATENGVSRLERILKIVPQSTRTLEERKFLILMRLGEELPFTMTTLKEQLEKIFGTDAYTLVYQADTYTLIIKIDLTNGNMFNEISDSIRKIVPANIVINMIAYIASQGKMYFASCSTAGEDTIIYPWNISKVECHGSIRYAINHHAVETVTIYPM